MYDELSMDVPSNSTCTERPCLPVDLLFSLPVITSYSFITSHLKASAQPGNLSII